MLDTISADRIRYEIECILQERYPEKVFRRADELNVLQKLHPPLKGNGWLAEKFGQARQLSHPNPPPVGLHLALLAYPLTSEENENLISRLRLSKSVAQTLRDAISIKSKLQLLANPELAPSSIYRLLHSYSPLALTTSLLACDSAVASCHIHLLLTKLRYIKPTLTGDDLKRMGIASGPHIREILHLLHEARLDGRVATKQDEESLVSNWLACNIKTS